MRDTTERYIIATGLLIAWSVCFAAKCLLPAILMAGRNYGNIADTYVYFTSKIPTPLSATSWLLLLAALVALVWALIGTYKKYHDKN